jgi:hypothetical protein
MPSSKEDLIKEKFREAVEKGDFSKINITHKISGGTPGEGRFEEEFYVSGYTGATLRIRSTGEPPKEISSNLKENDIRLLFEKLDKGIDSLVIRENARFIPDSMVGSVTIEVNGDQATFYYLAEEEEREAQDQPVSKKMVDTIKKFTELSKRLQKQLEK